MIRYNGEDAKIHEVGHEVDKKHSACELLPLEIQEPVHGLHLEHLVAFLDRRGGVSEEQTSDGGSPMPRLTGMPLPYTSISNTELSS